MNKNSKIFIAGHNGMLGSSILRNLKEKGYNNIITQNHINLDLTNQKEVNQYFKENSPDYVINAAAKVGGILSNNTYRAQFIYENLMIQNNLIHSSYEFNIKKFLFLGSSCIYPRDCNQPIKEEYLLSGTLELTNEPYAIAKIAGIKMCESYWKQYGSNFISVMPTNLYGENDNFDLENSHVLPALIRKFHEAKINNKEEVTVWGSGSPKREFMYVDDCADACVFIFENINADNLYSRRVSHINIGCGIDITIKELSIMIGTIIGYEGNIIFDSSKPDGTKQKLLDISLLNELGWKNSLNLKEGIKKTYSWYLENINKVNNER